MPVLKKNESQYLHPDNYLQAMVMPNIGVDQQMLSGISWGVL